MKKYYLLSLILFCSLFALSDSRNLLSSDSYITGDDGVIRMYVNVLGHVKDPGTYLVYDGIDLLSILSQAGGFLNGANLNEIIIYSNDSNHVVDLKYFLDSDSQDINSLIDLTPHSTIFVKQKEFSKFFSSSNIPTIILGMMNILITLDRTD